jgi:hypothetical protein
MDEGVICSKNKYPIWMRGSFIPIEVHSTNPGSLDVDYGVK